MAILDRMEILNSKQKRVALVLGARHNFWLDQRVQRTAYTLSNANYEVLAFTPAESMEQQRNMKGVIPQYISAPGGNNRVFKQLLLDYLLYNIPAALSMKKNKIQICHCNDFDTLPSGVLLKMMTIGKTKIVYDSHEDYPLFLEWARGKLLAKIIGIAEALLTRLFVDLVISTTDGVRARFERMGVKSATVFNYQELMNNDLAYENQMVSNKDKEFWVTYQGNVCKSRGYEQLVEAADILIRIKRIEKIRFIIIGEGKPTPSYREHIERLVADKKLEGNFLFTGFMPHDKLMQILACSDVGVIPLQPAPWYSQTLPNKLFENFVAGIATVASNFPEMAKIINQEKCGLLIDATRPEEIADAIEYLYTNEDVRLEMGKNALKAAREEYNLATQSKKLVALYSDIH